MDYPSSPIDSSQSSPKSNNNSRLLNEIEEEQPIKDSNDPSASYNILSDQNVIGILTDQTGNNVHSNDSKSDRSKTIIDYSRIRTESSDFLMILEQDEELIDENTMVCFFRYTYFFTNI